MGVVHHESGICSKTKAVFSDTRRLDDRLEDQALIPSSALFVALRTPIFPGFSRMVARLFANPRRQWGFKNSRIPHFSRLSWLLGTTKWAKVELMSGPTRASEAPIVLANTPIALDQAPSGWTYQGEGHGLYGGGSNTPPPRILDAAMANSAQVLPRGRDGRVVSDGKIGVIQVGPSFVEMLGNTLSTIARASGQLNKSVVFVNCGQSGAVAPNWGYYGSVWAEALKLTAGAGLTPNQIQVILIDDITVHPWQLGSFQNRISVSAGQLQATINVAKYLLPNLKLIYVIPFHNASGAGPQRAITEPYAYEDVFAKQRVVLSQQLGSGPTVLMGPYDWGSIPASDFYDGIHPSTAGIRDICEFYWSTLTKDPTAKGWLLRTY